MQKTFSLYPSPLWLGEVYDDSLNQIDTFAAEAAIKFGQPVMLGALTDQTIVNSSPTRGVPAITSVKPSDGTNFIGIALRSDVIPVGSTLAANNTVDYTTLITRTDDTYAISSPLRVMRVGRICVNVNTVTAASNQVYYTNTGNIVVNTSAPASSVLIGTALWTVTAVGLCVIQVNKLI
ncbi:hypothetical protein Trichorick_01441 (plasmid) [Candidatus Trichorickettsia mobilis]|uniref:Uncharacterized protein n=1 Tax=Candidatus Trichorickettsia mobilis TaxID=1346319 RepID=A0ABZ0UV59_9RICK|nr:hypothetical protein [Candidatus Trichorickettsia mobilis]WPY01528.1 hypothetical protein Trichorick_01441 [Candidatus Trichorickettsia mobilis]